MMREFFIGVNNFRDFCRSVHVTTNPDLLDSQSAPDFSLSLRGPERGTMRIASTPDHEISRNMDWELVGHKH